MTIIVTTLKAAVATTALCLALPASAVELIIDGSFERGIDLPWRAPDNTSNAFVTQYRGSVANAGPGIDGFTYALAAFRSGSTTAQSIGLVQTFSLTTLSDLQLKFNAGLFRLTAADVSSLTIQAFVNGVQLVNATPATPFFVVSLPNLGSSYSGTIRLGPGTYDLAFKFVRSGVVNSLFNGVALDAVSLDATAVATPAVPEPATWAMVITGFGVVGASLRRRRSALRGLQLT